jgi:hypothetical protein
MGHPDPRQAVMAHLTQPTGREALMPEATQEINPSTGPVASFRRGKSFEADPDSIEFRKERGTEDRRLFAVSFTDEAGNDWFWLVAAELDETGWTAHGVAGGTDGPAPGRRPGLTRAAPWLNLCGQWGADRFYAGGELHVGNSRVGLVRVTLADGTQLSDDGDAGVALFVGRRGDPPAVVDIFASNGMLLSSRTAF